MNLEALIEEFSYLIAERVNEAVFLSHSEEDIRHECNKYLDDFISKAGLAIKGRHEYGLAGGRIDSKYGGVVIEYKDPRGAGRLSEDKDSPGVRSIVSQIAKRFHDLKTEERVAEERIFGVGWDGNIFVFVRKRGCQLEVEDPQPVTPLTVERLLRALVSLSATGLSYTPEELANSFGADSITAQEGIRLIHQAIHDTDNAKAHTFFSQWQVLFGEVCGYDLHGQNSKVRKLARHYHVINPDPAELLFAVHTYYALFIKLLAAEIVSCFSPLGTSMVKKLVSTATPEKLRDELFELERGGIWSQIGIKNFLEGDLFSWYLDVWDERLAKAARSLIQALDRFDPTTMSVDPIESRDLLKQLYQHLFPPSVRHDLGEYYTPDWLAELTLNELGYDGNPDKRLLDPACGSGTFLVMAVNRVKRWFIEHRHECGFGEEELLRRILSNIIGFDLNPLAAMAARTNYLLALRELLRHAGTIELPVYLCDSIMTPSEYGDLFTGGHGKARKIKTSVQEFIIPTEVAENRELMGRYADLLEFCVNNRYAATEFLKRCADEGLPHAEQGLHTELYLKLQRLDADHQNGIWARIIKNAFAPLFVGQVDFVAGNPPWVNWESLPEEYRKGIIPLWREYGLFTLSGSAGRLGGGKKDLSMLFTYAAADNYLKDGGRLGFVITQTVFKTKGAGEGFRRLRFERGRRKIFLKPLRVHDLSAIQVFEGATNRTAVLVVEKRRRPFAYPVSYTVWRGPSRLSPKSSLKEARSQVNEIQLGAWPVDPNHPESPWMTAPKAALKGLRKVIGKSDYQAYAGCCTWLNGVYWIQIIEQRPNGLLVIENLHNVGKIKTKQVSTVIEPDLVYPLLRGRDVKRWQAAPSAQIILTQDPTTRRGIPETDMKRYYPKTYAYLKQFEGDPDDPQRGTLRGRSGFRQYFKPSDPFYSIYNVGPYTLAKWKVMWPEVGHSVRAGVCGPATVEKAKPSLPDHTIIAVSCESAAEAHFIAGLLNSAPATVAAASYIVLHPSPHIMENIAIPRFQPKNKVHVAIASLAKRCHEAMKKSQNEKVLGAEAEIDFLAAKLWGITDSELSAIRESRDGTYDPTGDDGDCEGTGEDDE